MKKYFSTLGLVILGLFGCVGQVQISDVQNLVIDDYANRKFIATADKLLLFEFSGFKTTVYKAGESGLTKTQEWVYDFKEQRRLTSNENMCYLVGDTLFEIFNGSIVTTNIIDGKQIAVYMMPDSIQNILIIDFDKDSDEWMLTYTDDNFVNHYGIFNSKTGSFTGRKLTDGYRVGNKVYKVVNFTLVSEDIYTGEITSAFNGITNKFNSASTKTAPYLWIGTSQGDNYYIDDEHGMREIPCPIPSQAAAVYWVDSLLFYNITTFPYPTYNVFNTKSCTLLSSNMAEGYMFFYTLFTPQEKYICYTVLGTQSESGYHYVYDRKLNKWNVLNIKGHDCYPVTQQFLSDRIYMLGVDRSDPNGNIVGFYEMDLKSKFVVNHKFYDQTDNAFFAHFGIDSKTGYVYVATRSRKNQSDLWVQKGKAKNPSQVSSFLTSKNFGIPYIFSELEYKGQYFYSTPMGIYVLSGNTNTLLQETNNNANLVRRGDFIYAIIQKKDNTFGYLKINTITQQTEFKSIQGSPNLARVYPVKDQAILAGDNFDGGFLNLTDGTYKKIKYNGVELQTVNITVSGSNVLFHGFNAGLAELYHWNLTTNIIKIIPDYGNRFPKVLPDYEGGFYFLPGNSGAGDKIRKMDTQGNLMDVTTVGNQPWYYYIDYTGLAGEVHTFPFPGENEVIFHSEKQGKINVNRIPFDNTAYYQNLSWIETNETVVVETEINGLFHTWIWKFDEQPYDVTPDGKNARLFRALIEGDSVVLLYYDASSRKTTLSLYNSKDRVLDEKTTFPSINYNLQLVESNYIYDKDNTWYLALNMRDSGEELWSYNVVKNELKLVNDFILGSGGGYPSNFTKFDQNILFLSNAADGSRQLFIINGSTAVTDLEGTEYQAILYPNPATNHITLDCDLKKLEILDIKGSKIFAGEELRKGSSIDITGYESGIYLVKGLNTEGKNTTFKLFVFKDK